MVIRVFVASSSGSVAVIETIPSKPIKKRQQDVVRFLEANRIEFEEVDITMSEEKRQWMYKNIPEDRQPAQGNPLPPQIFSDDRYCGDYDGFFESKESNTVFSFLGLKPTLASKMYSMSGINLSLSRERAFRSEELHSIAVKYALESLSKVMVAGVYRDGFCEKLLETFPIPNGANASQLQDEVAADQTETIGDGAALLQ
ncbi:hypothetical protein TURU_100263 [Turdus rufiventris]|nr:hypothetical protein TURU_100263 [Turdus rufiventris]